MDQTIKVIRYKKYFRVSFFRIVMFLIIQLIFITSLVVVFRSVQNTLEKDIRILALEIVLLKQNDSSQDTLLIKSEQFFKAFEDRAYVIDRILTNKKESKYLMGGRKWWTGITLLSI